MVDTEFQVYAPFDGTYEHLRPNLSHLPVDNWNPLAVGGEVYHGLCSYIGAWKEIPYSFPSDFSRDFNEIVKITRYDELLFLLSAAIWIVFRVGCQQAFKRLEHHLFPDNRDKFNESCCRLVSKFILCPANLYVAWKYDIITRPLEISDIPLHSTIPWDMHAIYTLEMGYYIQNVILGFVLDDRRRDFLPTMVHHVVTILLISFSFGTRNCKHGILILALHEPCDTFILMGKISSYCKRRPACDYSRAWAIVGHINVVLLGVSWFGLRIWWYWVKVLRSSLVGVQLSSPYFPMPLYSFFNFLLIVLYGLNIMWAWILIDFLFRIATGRMEEAHDPREEDAFKNVSAQLNQEMKKNPHIKEE